MKRSLKTKQGFTLIELIIVIVILGILSAVAIPKFAGLSGDAKKAAVEGIAGAAGAAAVTVHAKYLIHPPASGSTTIKLEGKDITLATGATVGYPSEADGGINNALTWSSSKFYFDPGSDTSDTNTDNASFCYGDSCNFTTGKRCYAWYGVKDNGTAVGVMTDGCN